MRRMNAIIIRLTVIGLVVPNALAETVQLTPSQDNTLYQSVGGFISNGAGVHLFAGRTDDGRLRRAVMKFDVAGNVPAGATIDMVSLRVFVTRARLGGTNATLHRLLDEWGEGTSNPLPETQSHRDGQGAPSTAGDATWIHRFFPDTFWQSSGGDFVASASATTIVGDDGQAYTWTTTAGMVANVQQWLDDSSSNWGWLVRVNEAANRSAKRIGSRENTIASRRPLLTIDFTPPAAPGDCDDDGDIDLDDFAAFQECFSGPGGDPPGPECRCADLDGDDDVDLVDMGILQIVFTGTGG